jgi:hypothetical protein
MRVDSLGRIWVGYFDEGVYGNFGWGGQNGPVPVGAAGLVCFSDSGEKLWEFPQDGDHSIDDCYALNVSGSEAAAFYTDFPLCKVSRDYELTFRKANLAGCHAFAFSETEALFSGQYGEAPDIAYLGKADADRTRGYTAIAPVDARRIGARSRPAIGSWQISLPLRRKQSVRLQP